MLRRRSFGAGARSPQSEKPTYAKASVGEGTLCFIRKFEANSGLRPCSGAEALAQAPEAHGVRSPPTLKLRWAKAHYVLLESLKLIADCVRRSPRSKKPTYAKASVGEGGDQGIRTLDTVSRIHTFQACLFNHSSRSPIPSSLKASMGGKNKELDFSSFAARE